MKKEAYKMLVGKKIRIKEMKGEEQYTDKEGIVEYVDDLPSLHGTWGGCSILLGIDKYMVIG